MIDGFSSLLDKGNGWTYSSAFQIRGLNWYNHHMLLFHFSYSNREHAMSKFHSLVSLDLFRRYLRLNPMVTKIGGKEEYVSLNLMLAQPSIISGMVVEASFKFLMYDQLYGKHHEQHQGTLANYS